ncbi:hypothetical protein Pelo_7382 [Pelomyxa schiedti]|nr:hypothetical protein Pelo_7382 [Pelomyxa schiedti]
MYLLVLSLLVFGSGGDGVGVPVAGNEIDDFMDLCKQFLDECLACEQEWAALENQVIDSVDSFANRIMCTEQLILMEAQQIGYMADRIVHTEEILANLTKTCVPFCHGTAVLPQRIQVALKQEPSVLEMPTGERKGEGTEGNQPPEAGERLKYDHCAPIEEMNQVINASIALFAELCSDVTSLLSEMDKCVEELGNDIIATEFDIMNMSSQIGVMADAIVETEEMAEEAAATCCTALQPNITVNPKIGDQEIISASIPDQCIPFYPPVNRGRQHIRNIVAVSAPVLSHSKAQVAGFAEIRHRLLIATWKNGAQLHTDFPCDTWWNPFCCAMEICADIMIYMMDGMLWMANQTTVAMEGVIDQVLEMSDEILQEEDLILAMGLQISDMTEQILYTESMMQAFVEDFCNNLGLRYTQRNQGPIEAMAVKNLPTITPTKVLELVPFPGLMESTILKDIQATLQGTREGGMIQLFIEFLETMKAFMIDETQIMKHMFEEMDNLAQDIVTTSGYILQMADQINDMAGRITQTQNIMYSLIDDCL